MGKNQYKLRTFICDGCGQTVTAHVPKNRKYCKASCYEGSPRPSRKKGREANCEYCGGVFYLSIARIKRGKHFFCCLDHQIAWQGRNKVDFTCKICGKPFRWSKSHTIDSTPRYCSIRCRDKDPERTQQLITMNLRQQELTPNKLEIAGYKLLKDTGVNFEPQKLIADKFLVDAYLPEHNTIVQFDGDYWHANPAKYQALDHRQARRVIIDKSQNAYFAKCGYAVLRFWESDIKKRPGWVVEQIKLHLSPAFQAPI